MMEQINKIGIISGYFSFCHQGHIEYINASKLQCDKLIVIINNDKQSKLKGSIQIIDEEHRCFMMNSLKNVDEVKLSIDLDKSVCKTLISIREEYPNDKLIFFNSGDRFNINNTNKEELEVCKKYKIKYVAINLPKIYSSSELLKNAFIKYKELNE